MKTKPRKLIEKVDRESHSRGTGGLLRGNNSEFSSSYHATVTEILVIERIVLGVSGAVTMK